MSIYRFRTQTNVRDLSEFEPIDWHNIYNLDTGTDELMKKFKIEVIRAMRIHGIEFPGEIRNVEVILSEWTGMQSDLLVEKLGKLAIGRGYEARIVFDCDYEKVEEDLYQEIEDRINDMVEKSTYFQEMMKNYECIIIVDYKRDYTKFLDIHDLFGIDG